MFSFYVSFLSFRIIHSPPLNNPLLTVFVCGLYETGMVLSHGLSTDGLKGKTFVLPVVSCVPLTKDTCHLPFMLIGPCSLVVEGRGNWQQ